MSKIKIGFMIIFLSHLCIGNNEEFRIININMFEEGSYLPVKSGQKFIIELEGNPSTGYSWFLGSPEKLDKTLLVPLNLNDKNSGEYYQKNDGGRPRLGSGGIFHFKFQANENNSGTIILSLIYKRPWTNEGESKKTINISVVNIHNNKDL